MVFNLSGKYVIFSSEDTIQGYLTALVKQSDIFHPGLMENIYFLSSISCDIEMRREYTITPHGETIVSFDYHHHVFKLLHSKHMSTITHHTTK